MQRLAQPQSVHKFLPKFDNPASLSSKFSSFLLMMSLLLRPVPKSHGTEPGSRHIVPVAALLQAPSHQLNPAPGT